MKIRSAQRVKYISREEIEGIAYHDLMEYDERSVKTPMVINEEFMVEEYFEADFEVKKLSTNMSILGASTFSGGELPVYDQFNRVEEIYVEPNTVIIDTHLEIKELEARKRFTVAHELGHLALHKGIFTVYQRSEDYEREGCNWNALDTIEWQANTYAAAMLMPHQTMGYAIECALKALSCSKESFKRNAKLDKKYYYTLVDIIANIYGVSFTVAKIRLKNHPELWV
jgi:hypothetical protein